MQHVFKVISIAVLVILIIITFLPMIVEEFEYSSLIQKLRYEYLLSNDQVELISYLRSVGEPKNTSTCRKQSEDTELIYELIPGCYSKFEGYPVKLPETEIIINQDGYRGKLYPKEKPNRTYRIVVLGDSFTFGWGLNITETFPYMLEQALNEDSDIEYQVINLAVPGYSTSNEQRMLEIKGMDYDPDLVIISFFKNDDENRTRLSGLRDGILKENYDWLSKIITPHQADVVSNIYGINLYYGEYTNENPYTKWLRVEEPLEKIDDMSLNFSFDVLLFNWEEILTQGYLVEMFCNNKDWYYLDGTEIVSEYGYGSLTLSRWDMHPSAFYHEEVASKVYNYITENILIDY